MVQQPTLYIMLDPSDVRPSKSTMSRITRVVVLITVLANAGFAQDRDMAGSRGARPSVRDARGLSGERMQLGENGRHLTESILGKSKPLDAGDPISDIRKAERVSDADRLPADDTAASSYIPLPNTMDGLNDKRPLSIGDKLSFRVVEDEGPPRTLSVTDSAEIDVPYIGRVPVANKTCKQFAYYIKRLLEKEYYYQATVIVGLDAAGAGTRAASRGKCYVMGQVRSPGPQDIPVDETYTVSKAILRAGGFGPYANKKKVKIVRGGKAGATGKPIYVDCAEIFDKGHWDKDVEVGPDDIVTVAEKWINFF